MIYYDVFLKKNLPQGNLSCTSSASVVRTRSTATSSHVSPSGRIVAVNESLHSVVGLALQLNSSGLNTKHPAFVYSVEAPGRLTNGASPSSQCKATANVSLWEARTLSALSSEPTAGQGVEAAKTPNTADTRKSNPVLIKALLVLFCCSSENP